MVTPAVPSPASQNTRDLKRARLTVHGAVQGVGYRPFVYRLAHVNGLKGWVRNDPAGVVIEVEGHDAAVAQFVTRIETDKPPNARIHDVRTEWIEPAGYTEFCIRESTQQGRKSAVILPDIAMCDDCRAEIGDPDDRRYRYPFTNCTNCGPRFTIIESMPYDRSGTTMKAFTMCAECRREYDDPDNRRFHAQPNACPVCGPHLEYWDSHGGKLADGDAALRAAAEDIRQGRIVAVKGLGGFHLIVDARNTGAVLRLRQRKHREEKPLALIYPDLEAIRSGCIVTLAAERLLCSPESPIVLLERRELAGISESVAGPAPTLGVMLPCTPLHHLLLGDLGFPVVATSGNLSDEPICIDEREAVARLSGIADAFLVHDRPITRHVDDAIVRVVAGRPIVLRRARGYAPLPVAKPHGNGDAPVILAVGAHLKNALAVLSESGITVSQHIGDLETLEAHKAFVKVATDLPHLLDTAPERIACDLHPDYHATIWARRQSLPIEGVQHHHAHVVACMVDNDLDGEVLGAAWDGTGFGEDGTVWGGEFLACTRDTYSRIGHLRTFALPGSDAAVREPRRSALGLLYELFGDEVFERNDLGPVVAFTASERAALQRILRNNINVSRTSSVGRLFDAVASILNLRQIARFEGQAAMLVEYAAIKSTTIGTFRYRITESDGTSGPLVLDWEPMIAEIVRAQKDGIPVPEIAAKFHNTLAAALAEMALRYEHTTGQRRVVLSGGCFQNTMLLEKSIAALQNAGLNPFWHQRIPPNDGGICAGQVAVALARWQHELETDNVPGDSR